MNIQIVDRKYQYLCTLGTTLGAFVSGSAFGLSSSSEIVFLKDYPHIKPHDIHFIDGCLKLGAAVAEISLGLSISYIGSRTAMKVTSVPYMIGWYILATGFSKEELCLGRFLLGFCLGAYCVAAPLYIAEISDKYIRGTLCEIFTMAMTFGTFVIYCLGEFENMLVLTVPFCILPLFWCLIMSYLPESPVDLYNKGLVDDAKKALVFFRGTEYDIQPELKEIEAYATTMRENFWKDLSRYSSIKAALMLIGMQCISALSGIYIIIMHAYRLCKMTNVFERPNHGAIILGAVQLVASSISTAVVDRVGRRPLWIVSLSAMAFGHIIIAHHFQIKRDENDRSLQPLIAMMILVAAYCLGAGPLPFVMNAELLPEDIKACICSIAMIFNWILGFVVLMSFQPIIDHKGAPYMFYTYAAFCALGIVFVFFVVIETKHKTLQEIQKELEGQPQAPSTA